MHVHVDGGDNKNVHVHDEIQLSIIFIMLKSIFQPTIIHVSEHKYIHFHVVHSNIEDRK